MSTPKLGFRAIRPRNELPAISPTFITIPGQVVGAVGSISDALNKFQIPDLQAIAQGAFNNAAAQLSVNIWQDRTFISDSTGLKNLLPSASVMSVSFNQPWAIASHPIETNSLINDHRYRQQKTVTVELIVANRDMASTNEAIGMIMSDNENLYSVVQDRILEYTNLTAESQSIRRDPSKYDSAVISLTFKEIILVKRSFEALDANDVAAERNQSMQRKNVTKNQNISDADALAKYTTSLDASYPKTPAIPAGVPI